MQQRRRDVGQATAGTHPGGRLGEALAYDKHIDQIQRVGSVRSLCLGIPHLLGVAMIGADHGLAAHLPRLVCLNRRVIADGNPREVLTSEVLEATYGAPMEVLEHGGMPLVIDHGRMHVQPEGS